MNKLAHIQTSAAEVPWESARCLLVAEIGNNHQGDPEMAKRCIQEAVKAGADMVKFQKRHMPSLFTKQGLDRPYNGVNSFGRTYGKHREHLELPVETMAHLKEYAEDLGGEFFASVWDAQSLADMQSIGVRLLKLPSADLTNLPLLRHCAATRLPIILSTGMSTLEDIDMAVNTVREVHDNIMLLHCNSTYPCQVEQISLPVIQILAERYGLAVGYSGHEIGMGPSVAAVALGARLVERHFTLDKKLPGSDHVCSLVPEEFAQLASMVRDVKAAMSVRDKQFFAAEQAMAAKLRKSLVSSRNLPQGHCISLSDVTLKCTGNLDEDSVTNAEFVTGRILLRPLTEGQPIYKADLSMSGKA